MIVVGQKAARELFAFSRRRLSRRASGAVATGQVVTDYLNVPAGGNEVVNAAARKGRGDPGYRPPQSPSLRKGEVIDMMPLVATSTLSTSSAIAAFS